MKKIYINGTQRNVEKDVYLTDVLNARVVAALPFCVMVNDAIVTRDDYSSVKIKDEDRVHVPESELCPRKKVADNVLELIGRTPLVKLNRMVQPGMASVLGKLESLNPGGSLKDRICLSIIEDAERKGLIRKGSTIIEPTSGNTGIGLAMVCAVKGYRCILTMPETMSLERIFILRSYGAEVVLTPGVKGILGSIERAEELLKKIPDSFMPQQFKNPANPAIHRITTALEILNDTEGNIDVFVAGVGTGGSITGVGEVLKKYNPAVKVVAVEPKKSAVLSGHKPGHHNIQGIGAGFVPDVLNRDIIDRIIQVNDREAFRTSRLLSQEEALFVGISSGANIWAALSIAKETGEGKTIVAVLCDTGERYFSMEQYFEA
ncbi:MAG: cysteine synthase A [Candidatus Auribacterota bacterium]